MKRNRKNEEKEEEDIEGSESDFDEDVDHVTEDEESDSEESDDGFVEEAFESESSDYESGDEEADEQDSELSDAEFDEDTKLPILTLKLSETLLKNASAHTNGAIKRLVAVFSSVVSSVASSQIKLTSSSDVKKQPKDSNVKLKFKYLKNENKRLLRGTASRYSDAKKPPTKKYAVKDTDVYNTFVAKTADVMSDYMKEKSVLANKEEVLAAAPMIRRFLSTALLQLAFTFDDFDLTRSTLISLTATHAMRWICTFRQLNSQFAKVVSSLMTAHPQKLTRINCFQFLSEYLKCATDAKLMSVQLAPRAYLINYSKLTDSERKSASNESVNLLLKRCYSSHIRAVMNGVTLKNFSLIKLTQNCISELYLQAPQDNVYVHAFRSIRDLAFNVRREWNSSNQKSAKKGSSSKKAKRKLPDEEDALDQGKHKPAMQFEVCSWGFIESINIWISVISRSGENMKALVYPLVTVINALVKIKINSKRYVPLVLHLLTALNQLSDGVNKFIPIGSFIFFVLDTLKSFKHNKPVKDELEKSEDIMIKLKLSKKNLHSDQVRKLLYKHVELVLVDHLGLVSLNPSFPEFTNPVTHILKKHIKSLSVPSEFKSAVNALFKIMKESSETVTDKREELPPEPMDILKVFEGTKVAMHEYRQQLLSKYQLMNREKLLSTLQDFSI
ncbi:uncharacterized protein TOT_010000847 [Theileria orientalis strain Shintoku]|uniref:Nucleolar complex protein 2 homolog n=1 Tax=Theileria orientalis strain Shintoku TaxID=869250 RepID=J4C2W3_THEOR|nr:uncharacterized protein TOT_010000847 [Theileria orientalis strain Shintoku]BAM39391.1 uncharacterized protein TOT_010000847 [Theileria orientalis strain Shintoku]|eukprot:XP_009689692.1 uncharacterized protein TOT_010000847 [Theileria orientalis strain Shintoku]